MYEGLTNFNFNFNSINFVNKPKMINCEQNDIQITSKAITADQMRILCEIDIVMFSDFNCILMLRRYYLLRNEVFKKHNQLYFRNQEKNNDNSIAQIKKRFQHSYQDKIAMMLCRLLDEVRNHQDKEFEDDNRLNDVEIIPAEFIELDAKLKEQTIESLDYCDPIQVYQEITKLMEKYLKSL